MSVETERTNITVYRTVFTAEQLRVMLMEAVEKRVGKPIGVAGVSVRIEPQQIATTGLPPVRVIVRIDHEHEAAKP